MQAFATRAIDVQRTDASMQLPFGLTLIRWNDARARNGGVRKGSAVFFYGGSMPDLTTNDAVRPTLFSHPGDSRLGTKIF